MAQAYASGDYTLAEVARVFGVHYSTVSRVVRGKWGFGQGTPSAEATDRRIDQ